MMSVSVISWWYFLCAVAALNIAVLFLSAIVLKRRAQDWSPAGYSTRRLLLVLSAVYVAGCAFRSVFPVYDIPRICVVDSWLSSVMVGRMASVALVPLIAIAEICSWYSVLTTSNIGHVAEESIWGFSVALLVTSLAILLPRCTAARRPLLLACCVAGSIYVAYMFLVDVPMYWSRWIADEVGGRHTMSIVQGAHDASVRWVVSHRWQDWKHEVVWMSLYFSVAVWISIALVHAPALETHVSTGQRRRLPSMLPSGIRRTMAERRI